MLKYCCGPGVWLSAKGNIGVTMAGEDLHVSRSWGQQPRSPFLVGCSVLYQRTEAPQLYQEPAKQVWKGAFRALLWDTPSTDLCI